MLIASFLLGLPVIVVCILIYRLWGHPLSAVPGPRLAAVSGLWYAFHVRNGRLLQLATTLHEQYGPAVRVGPNEVWFDSPDAFRTIYNPSHGLAKSDFYLATVLFRPKIVWWFPLRLAFPDTLDLLSERNMKRYRLQRRLIGPLYHETNMARFSKAVDVVLDRAVTEIASLATAEVDLKEWMHMVAVECLGAVVLSWSPRFLMSHTDFGSSSVSYMNWRRKSVLGLFPGLITVDFCVRWPAKLFSAAWGLGYDVPDGFKSFFPAVGARISTRIRKSLKAPPPSKPSATIVKTHPQNRDVMAELVGLHRNKPEFTDTYLRRMAMTNFGAGHETMCSALTAIVAMIGSHPEVLCRVASEVRGRKGVADIASARDAATAFPFTAASVREAQRLHPAIAMSLPRVVSVDDVSVELHGHHIPPGTVVGCSPLALHRNKGVFGDDADQFRPARWLEANAEQRRAMERINLTWGGGARTCPGRFLAELVIYKAVVALVRAFDVEATMPATDEIRYYFLAMLTGVRVRFRAIGETGPDACEIEQK